MADPRLHQPIGEPLTILGIADDGDYPHNARLLVYAVPKLAGEYAELPASHVSADDATNLNVVDQ